MRGTSANYDGVCTLWIIDEINLNCAKWKINYLISNLINKWVNIYDIRGYYILEQQIVSYESQMCTLIINSLKLVCSPLIPSSKDKILI